MATKEDLQDETMQLCEAQAQLYGNKVRMMLIQGDCMNKDIGDILQGFEKGLRRCD